MKNNYYCLIILIFFIILIFLYLVTGKKEYFDGTMCNLLNKKDGITCSIPSSPLFPAKCYKVGKNIMDPLGWFKKIGNIYDCMYYPDCNEIAGICNAPNLYKLQTGYVQLL